MFKKACLSYVIVLAVVTLVGCGGRQPEKPSPIATPSAATPAASQIQKETPEKPTPTLAPTLLSPTRLPSEEKKKQGAMFVFGSNSQHSFYLPYSGMAPVGMRWKVGADAAWGGGNAAGGANLAIIGFPRFVVATDGTVYAASGAYETGSSFSSHIIAIDTTGQPKWSIGFIGGHPLGLSSDGTLYARYKGSLFAFSPEGSQLWKMELGAGQLTNLVIGRDGTLYVAEQNGPLFAVNPDGTVRWIARISSSLFGPTIGQDDTVYISSSDGEILAYDPTGQRKWSNDAVSVTSFLSVGPDGTLYAQGISEVGKK